MYIQLYHISLQMTHCTLHNISYKKYLRKQFDIAFLEKHLKDLFVCSIGVLRRFQHIVVISNQSLSISPQVRSDYLSHMICSQM